MSVSALSSRPDASALQEIVLTLTPQRLSRYLRAADYDIERTLQLYVLNTKVSGALMANLHYVEVALRNKFDRELAARFGATWFNDPGFLRHADSRMQDIVQKAVRDASRNMRSHSLLPPGKVIAELTFGFWLQLTDRRFEHVLWTPALHKAFAPRKAPKRGVFSQLLEKLRQLRNRVAHHEPVFHLDLFTAHQQLVDACRQLCPPTGELMNNTSTLQAEVTRLMKFMASLSATTAASPSEAAPLAN